MFQTLLPAQGVRKYTKKMIEEKIYQINKGSSQWPIRLSVLKGMPEYLRFKGSIPGNSESTIAIVGARQCSPYGKRLAYEYGNALAKAGFSVVSGMARGIDSCAHQGAMDAGGKTYAILGCGVDICYPASSQKIYREIPKTGGIISEFPDGTPPVGYNFPRRNRIISAFADCVLVIEAKRKSGSLITADFALEQGRDVYAVPGRTSDALSEGCNHLISMGAGLALSPEMLIRELGISWYRPDHLLPDISFEDEDLTKIYDLLDERPMAFEVLQKKLDFSSDRLLQALLYLQLEGRIREIFRGTYIKIW